MANKKNGKLLTRILFCIFLALFIFSAVMLVRSLLEYKKEKDEHVSLEEDFLIFDDPGYDYTEPVPTLPASDSDPSQTTAVTLAPPSSENEATSASSGQNAETAAPPASEELPPETSAETTAPATAAPKPFWPNFTVNWEALCAKNSDVIGWIWMYDSDISYPVLLGADNSEYIHTTLDGTYAKFGSIFADYRSSADFSDRNTIIYGHNGGYGVKFGGLMNYRYYSHWSGHQYICILTPSGLSKYLIYSAYISKAEGNPYKTRFPTDGDYQAFIDQTVSASLYNTGIVPTLSDKVLTLSTCTNNADDERMIVHAIRVD